ncbi:MULTISPECIES: class I SAM-dependent DNA methyltransferase [unclassified Mesorhizobium]|uniref:class I SAM-dependent DNA methyltransferase n=1 Tax=unclassified Mesorhizobium TaxID=325217 RepID=UPI001FEF752C|nr:MULTISPECIES: class I SAM-dependent DNA methyltransferase [unclassified Mesorhizobium]
MVVWIGYLQQHYRTRTGHPAEPILRAFKNINFGHREGYDAVLTWDGYPVPKVVEREGKRLETFPNARWPDWPDAEFIVENPPFISNRDMRGLLSDGYVNQLKPLYREFTQAADLILFFWIRAAKSGIARRIGFVSTSRIRLSQNNAVLRNALSTRWFIRFAIPDHDWPSANDGASVRVAFITVDRASGPSLLMLAPDHDRVAGARRENDGYREINLENIGPNLAVGPNLTTMHEQQANLGICHAGVKPYSRALHIDAKARNVLFPNEADRERYSPAIMNGHDVGQRWRGLYVIDVNSFDQNQLRKDLPDAYNYILEKVKPEREKERNPRLRDEFWKFEANRSELRQALVDRSRFVVTLENSPQRYFVFLPKSILPDQKLRVVATEDAFVLAVLSSRAHSIFTVAVGGRAGKANTPVYNTSCFTLFPFPAPSDVLRQKLSDAGESLDEVRKKVLADYPDLTLTGLYNVLEKLKAGEVLTDKDEDIKDRGLVLILKEIHDTIDRLTAEAYGWSPDLSDEQILEKLVALNAERVKEEAAGHVRWLRPDYQIPRFAKGKAAESGELDLGEGVVAIDTGKPAFPKDRYEQPLAVEALLSASAVPLDAATISRSFKGGGKKIEQRVAQVLLTLARYGRVTPLSDGKYTSRKVA